MDRKITIAFYLVLAVFTIFILRLWHLQVIKGDEYSRIDERNRIRVLYIPAPRGIIYDRNDKPLVKNVLSFEVSMIREDMPKAAGALTELGRLVGLSYEQIKKLQKASPNPYEKVKLARDVPFEEVAKIEARRIDFPGLQVEVSSSREYLYGQAASHVLGYLGYITPEQLNSPEYRGSSSESVTGKFGVEKSYDSLLRGIDGMKVVEVDALGSTIKVVRIQRPVKGKDIKLTIDANLQVEAERSLEGRAGAVVALKADTGEVLALASAPSFNPNAFVGGISHSDWRGLMDDPRRPMMNRAIQSQYPPGSTFKPITALAALERGLVTEDRSVQCSGSTYFGRVFRCWKEGGHGSVALHKALVESCDVYFYDIGKRINIDALAEYATAFGLGRPTGIGLDGEASGLVPSSRWKLRAKKEKWYQGETLSIVIGQGYLTVTPIQMARLTAALANGGKLYKPHLLINGNENPAPESVVDADAEHMELIKKAMLGVVYEGGGTGGRARSNIVSISGKTGTAQVIGGTARGEVSPEKYKDHAWFVAFAPQYNPEIAVSVFVEHGGHGGAEAAPIAKRVIEAFYNPPKPEVEEEGSGEMQGPPEPGQESQQQVEPSTELKEQSEPVGD